MNQPTLYPTILFTTFFSFSISNCSYSLSPTPCILRKKLCVELCSAFKYSFRTSTSILPSLLPLPPPPVLLHSRLPHSQPLLTLPSDVIHAKDIHVSRMVSLACNCFALLLASNLLIRILPPLSSRLPPPFPLPPLSPLTACRYCFISCSSVSFLFVFFNSLLFFEFYSRYELPAEVIYLPSSPRHLLLSLKQLNSSLPPSLSPLLLEIEGIQANRICKFFINKQYNYMDYSIYNNITNISFVIRNKRNITA